MNKGKINVGLILISILILSIFYTMTVSSEPRGECCKCKNKDANGNYWQGADIMGGKSCKDACSKNGGFDKENYTPRGPGMCGYPCSNVKSACTKEGEAKCLNPDVSNKREICDQDKDPFICNWISADCAKTQICYKDPVLGDKCKDKGTDITLMDTTLLDQSSPQSTATPAPQ